MSEVDTYKGEIKPVDGEGKTLEELCQSLCEAGGATERKSFYGSWEEQLRDDLCEKYVVANGRVYELVSRSGLQCEDIFEAAKLPNGNISYLVQYYNGGCSFEEAVENALQNVRPPHEP